MELTIYFDDGTVEQFSTGTLTASDPLKGGTAMTHAVARYEEEPWKLPYGRHEEMDPGLVVMIFQYEAQGDDIAVQRPMAKIGIAGMERMRRAELVVRDGEAWLVREPVSGELADLSRLNAFGRAYIDRWRGMGACEAVVEAAACAGRIDGAGMFDRADVIAERFGLPVEFVASAIAGAGMGGGAADEAGE